MVVQARGQAAVFGRGAVVWVNGRQAVVATGSRRGRPTVVEVTREIEPEGSFLGRVVREIGDRERVVILGPGSARLALEREYVSMYQRPDRLVDVEPAGPVTERELVERLGALTG